MEQVEKQKPPQNLRKIILAILTITGFVVLVGGMIYQMVTRGDLLLFVIILSCFSSITALLWHEEKKRERNDN